MNYLIDIFKKNCLGNSDLSSVKVRLKQESHQTSFSKNESFKMIEMISGRLVR
jgi:hypothetical protein